MVHDPLLQGLQPISFLDPAIKSSFCRSCRKELPELLKILRGEAAVGSGGRGQIPQEMKLEEEEGLVVRREGGPALCPQEAESVGLIQSAVSLFCTEQSCGRVLRRTAGTLLGGHAGFSNPRGRVCILALTLTI